MLAPLLTGRAAGELLFSKPDGSPIDRWWVRDALRRQAAPLGGIPTQRATQLYPHMLRSTFITHAFALGMAPDKVQRAARHANLATTMRYNPPTRTSADTPPTSSKPTWPPRKSRHAREREFPALPGAGQAGWPVWGMESTIRHLRAGPALWRRPHQVDGCPALSMVPVRWSSWDAR
ncbi:tyrosine-type recombinase/integrase [Nonomuraea thailandensis]|uniref:tyrosine-type recombinase/integrase n=1 Tax=Nonomuraea thailandensis TaxID=1188745 RepID=UPI00337BBE20